MESEKVNFPSTTYDESFRTGMFSLYWTKYTISSLSMSDDAVRLNSFLFEHEDKIISDKISSFFIRMQI